MGVWGRGRRTKEEGSKKVGVTEMRTSEARINSSSLWDEPCFTGATDPDFPFW